MLEKRPERRSAFAVGLVAWFLLCLWCVHGTPPGVDLPAHAAQIETLAGLFSGRPELTAHFEARFVPGYGLVSWLMVPVALAFNGAVAARFALFISMAGLLPAMALLLRTARLPPALCFFAAPFAFSFAYWYGFLPELFARTLAVLAVAAWLAFRNQGGAGREARAAFLMGLVAFAHVLTFGLLLLSVITLSLLQRNARRLLRPVLPGVLVSGWSLLEIRKAVDPTGAHGWRWDGVGHLLFFFRNYTQEGTIGLVASLILFALLLIPPARSRRALAVVSVLCIAYLACPRDVGQAYVLCFRLPSLIGLAAVCAGAAVLGSYWRTMLAAVCVAIALFQTVAFHRVFRTSVAGLTSVTGQERTRAYLSLQGPRLPSTRFPYLEHFGEWITASEGGIGTAFFADAPNQPVQRRRDAQPAFQPEALYVFGSGVLPAEVEHWCLRARAFAWRRYQECLGD